MEIYFVYFTILFLLWVIATSKNRQKTDANLLRFALILMYIMFVSRDFSVGRDIPGYMEQYEITAEYPFWQFDYVYFENGYLLLYKIFNLFNLPFRAFFVFIYALILIPLYYFLKNHSKDPIFSLIIYYCYQFFVLDMSGLRQSIAMSICLIAYMVLRSERRHRLLFSALILAAAYSIHHSAIMFLFIGLLVLKKETRFSNIVLSFVYIGAILFFRQFNQYILLMVQDQELRNYGFNEDLRAGSTLILNIGWLLFMLYVFFSKRLTGKYRDLLVKYLHIMICACVTMLALAGSPLLRAASYFLVFLLIALPEFLSLIGTRSSVSMIKLFIIGLYFYMFYSTVLVPSQFDIVPYKFAF